MTAIKVQNVSEVHKSPENKNPRENRNTTDKIGFGIFSFVILSLVILPGIAKPEFSIFENATTSENKTSADTDAEALTNLYSFINTTINLTGDDVDLSSNSYLSIFGTSLRGFYKAITFIVLLRWLFIPLIIYYKATKALDATDFAEHYIIINAGRIIVTAAFLVAMKFLWISASLYEDFIIHVLIAELSILLFSKLPLLTAMKKRDYKKILRYYAARRNIIIFQFLNVMVMLSFMACIVIALKSFYILKIFSLIVVSFFLVSLMHDYAKMVIILASSSHNWDEDKSGVSIKTILSSMMTIGRYHLGTIIVYSISRHFYIPGIYDSNAKILTAVHGVSALNALVLCDDLQRNKKLDPDFETPQSSVWKDMKNLSLCILYFVLFGYREIETGEEFISRIIIFASYILLNGFYFYVFISPADTFENTVQFCKLMKIHNVKISDIEPIWKKDSDATKQLDFDENCEENEDEVKCKSVKVTCV